MKVFYIKKKFLYLIVGALVILIIISTIANRGNPVFSSSIDNKIIGIDPGHGGIDSGAVGKGGTNEAEINLSIALKLKKIIEENGGIVVMTREDDRGLYTQESKTVKEKKTEDLKNRKKVIDSEDCDVFLTIHLNSFPQSKYYGAQTFYKIGCKDSEQLAFAIQDEFRNILDKNNKRTPQSRDDVYLIKEIEVPSVLIECGFLSNAREEELLSDEKYQEKIAQSIYLGIIKYFEEKE